MWGAHQGHDVDRGDGQEGHPQRRHLARVQGLTLVHFSAQLEPCLTHKSTLHTLNTPYHRLNTGYTTPTRTPYPIKSAQVELRSERV